MGNDVVDLSLEENHGRSKDLRFLNRVFLPAEQTLIAGSLLPDAFLWALWAGKEAAYKAVSRLDWTVNAIPRQYVVSLTGGGASGPSVLLPKASERPAAPAAAATMLPVGPGGRGLLIGHVATPRESVALQVLITPRFCHALAAEPGTDFSAFHCQVQELSDPEVDPSVQVRSLLRADVARERFCPEEEIEIRKDPCGPGAPCLFCRDVPLPIEISLSHDGAWVAYVWRPRI